MKTKKAILSLILAVLMPSLSWAGSATAITTANKGSQQLKQPDTFSQMAGVKADGTPILLHLNADGSLAVSTGTQSSSTVTANAGANLNTSALALESGGNIAAILLKLNGVIATSASGASTSSNQSTEITALNQIHSDLIAPLPSGSGTIGSVLLTDGSNSPSISIAPTDGTPLNANRLRTTSFIMGYNGSTIDMLRSSISGIISSVTGHLNTLWKGKYNAAGVTLSDGQWTDPQLDVNGNLKVSGSFFQATQPISSAVALPHSDAGVLSATTVAITANGQSTAAIPISGFNSVNAGCYGTFSTVNITPQISFDGGTTWAGVLLTRLDIANTAAVLLTGNQSAAYSFTFPTMGATHCRFTSTAWTSGQENIRVTPSLMPPQQAYLTTVYNGTQAVTIAANSSVNLAQVGGSTPNTNVTQGSTNKATGVLVSGVSNSTLTTTAFAGNGATNGATQAVTDGGAVSASFDINVTTLTLGTATSVLFVIQDSYDNGTTYNDVWVSQPVTATAHIRVPAVPLHGRFRLRAWSIGGTSTTVTVATNVMEIPTEVLVMRQFCDVYAATNPFNSMHNGVSVASTLVSTTISSTSAIANVEGCKNITISGVFTGGIPTTAPVYSLQVSQDATNWFTTATTISPTAAGTFGANYSGGAWRFARLIVTTASSGGTPYGVTYTSINGTN